MMNDAHLQMPPLNPLRSSRFSIRNWRRNGVSSLLTTAFAILGLLNLFQPWEPDYRGAGYSTTQWEGNEIVRREYIGTTAKGGGNAFTTANGWIPLIGFAATLFACGCPRQVVDRLRWVPLGAGIIIFAFVFNEFRAQAKVREEWLSRFSTRPVVTESAAMRWVIIFSFGMIFSGAFFACRKGNRPPPPLPGQIP